MPVVPLGVAAVTNEKGDAGDPTSNGIGHSFQRGTFTAAGRDWLIYADTPGSEPTCVYATSTADGGQTWSQPFLIRDLGEYHEASGISYCDFHFDGTYLHYVIAGIWNDVISPPLCYRRGEPKPDGTIEWSSSESSFQFTGNSVLEVSIETDSEGYPWITFEDYGGDGAPQPYYVRSFSNDGTFIPTDDPERLSDLDTHWWTGVVRLDDDGGMVVFYWHDEFDFEIETPPTGTETIYARAYLGNAGWTEEIAVDDPKRTDQIGDGLTSNVCFVGDPANEDAYLIYSDTQDDKTYLWSWQQAGTEEVPIPAAWTSCCGIDETTGELVLVYKEEASSGDIKAIRRTPDPEGAVWGEPEVLVEDVEIRRGTLQITERGERLLLAFQVPNSVGPDPIHVFAFGEVPAGSPPANVTPPVVSGVPVEGQVVSCSTGDWTGDPTSYTYQWFTGFSFGFPDFIGIFQNPIEGATKSTLWLTKELVNQWVFCAVTAHNEYGSSDPVASSNEIGLIVGLKVGSLVAGGGSAVTTGERVEPTPEAASIADGAGAAATTGLRVSDGASAAAGAAGAATAGEAVPGGPSLCEGAGQATTGVPFAPSMPGGVSVAAAAGAADTSGHRVSAAASNTAGAPAAMTAGERVIEGPVATGESVCAGGGGATTGVPLSPPPPGAASAAGGAAGATTTGVRVGVSHRDEPSGLPFPIFAQEPGSVALGAGDAATVAERVQQGEATSVVAGAGAASTSGHRVSFGASVAAGAGAAATTGEARIAGEATSTAAGAGAAATSGYRVSADSSSVAGAASASTLGVAANPRDSRAAGGAAATTSGHRVSPGSTFAEGAGDGAATGARVSVSVSVAAGAAAAITVGGAFDESASAVDGGGDGATTGYRVSPAQVSVAGAGDGAGAGVRVSVGASVSVGAAGASTEGVKRERAGDSVAVSAAAAATTGYRVAFAESVAAGAGAGVTVEFMESDLGITHPTRLAIGNPAPLVFDIGTAG